MQLAFFDTDIMRQHLAPLSFTRPLAAFRTGLLTHAEKWLHELNGQHCGYFTADYLSEAFTKPQVQECIVIAGYLLPSPELSESILNLKVGQALYHNDELLAANGNTEQLAGIINGTLNGFQKISFSGELHCIRRCWDIFTSLEREAPADYARLTNGQKSAALHTSNTLIGPEDRLFIHETATVYGATINTLNGPVYIGPHAEVMEGSLIRGPFLLGAHSALKLGSKVYGPTALGPHVKAGGELNNVQIFGYSNKAHDGFLGNAVLGEWCNLGADTNNSNLKNNYAPVKMWNYALGRFEDTGRQFAGLVMGDHSKTGINSMLNTGTVVGISCNIFGAGFPRNFVPDFSWGGAQGFTVYKIDTALETMERVLERRKMKLNPEWEKIYRHLFETLGS